MLGIETGVSPLLSKFDKDFGDWVSAIRANNHTQNMYEQTVDVEQEGKRLYLHIQCIAKRELAPGLQFSGSMASDPEMLKLNTEFGDLLSAKPKVNFICKLNLKGPEEFTVQIRKIIEEKGIACIV